MNYATLILNKSEAVALAKMIHSFRNLYMQTNMEMHSVVCPEQMIAVLDAPSGEIFLTMLNHAHGSKMQEHHSSLMAFEYAYNL